MLIMEKLVFLICCLACYISTIKAFLPVPEHHLPILSDVIIRDQSKNHDTAQVKDLDHLIMMAQPDKIVEQQPAVIKKHILVQTQDQPTHFETIFSIPSLHKQVFNPNRTSNPIENIPKENFQNDKDTANQNTIGDTSSLKKNSRKFDFNAELANNNYNKCVKRSPLPKDLKAFIGCLNDLEFELMSCSDDTVYVKHLDTCELKSNFICNQNPCKSGGICLSDSKNTFHCECPKGFTGKTCENVVDACLSNPCESVGVAENKCHQIAPGNAIAYYCECFGNQKFGLKCDSTAEMNPCLDNKKERLFPTKMNKSVFVQCTGTKLVVMPCPVSLAFSISTQRCDW